MLSIVSCHYVFHGRCLPLVLVSPGRYPPENREFTSPSELYAGDFLSLSLSPLPVQESLHFSLGWLLRSGALLSLQKIPLLTLFSGPQATPPPLPTPISNSPNSNGQEMPLRSLSRGPSGFKGSGSHMNNTSSAASSSHSRLSSPSAAVRPTASLHNLRRSGGVMPSLDFSPSKPQ